MMMIQNIKPRWGVLTTEPCVTDEDRPLSLCGQCQQEEKGDGSLGDLTLSFLSFIVFSPLASPGEGGQKTGQLEPFFPRRFTG